MVQYCCKWNEHIPNLLTKLESLKDAANYVDVTLVCEGHSIKAHKLVLSTCSPLFHEMFLSNACSHPFIMLQDMKFSVLQAMVNFMYRGEINVQQDDLELLLKAAKTLRVKSLIDICKEMLIGVMITDKEGGSACNSAPQNSSFSDSSLLNKRARKGLVDDKVPANNNVNINLEGVSNQTAEYNKFNAHSPETFTFSMTSTAGTHSNDDPLYSCQNSVPEAAPSRNAATISDDEDTYLRKQRNIKRFHEKEAHAADDIDDGEGSLLLNRTSYLWNFFTPLNDSIAECNICLLNKSYKSSISNLKSHLQKKHPSVDLRTARSLHNSTLAKDASDGPKYGKIISSEDMHLNCPEDAYTRKRISYLWNYFTPKGDKTAICHTCSAVTSYKSSITNLRSHLQRKHPNIVLPCSSKDYDQNSDLQTTSIELQEASPAVEVTPDALVQTVVLPADNTSTMPIILKLV